MRLIDADELIVQFRRAIETFLPNDPRRHMNLGDSLKCHGWEQGLMVIQEAPTIQPSPHWIPVTERLPKEDGSYLVSGKWGSGKEYVGDCEFSVEDGYFQIAWNFDVLAWMPLPEPFKGVME